jgi:hypothetical protein
MTNITIIRPNKIKRAESVREITKSVIAFSLIFGLLYLVLLVG